MQIEVQLTRNTIALIDAEDEELVSGFSWHVTSTGYAATRHPKTGGHIYMHRLICGAAKGAAVDHINGDKLDNRRANLRTCTTAQNNANKRQQSNNKSSRYKGVTFDAEKGLWLAQVSCGGLRRSGRFRSENEAAQFYNTNALELFGEFAQQNIIEAEDDFIEVPIYSLNCANCGAVHHSTNGFQKYCGVRCRDIAQYKRRRLSRRANA